MEEKKIS